MALMNLRHVSTDGKTLQEHSFKCGSCKNDVPCSLVFVEGGHPCPYNLPLYCQTCFAFVGMINANPATATELEPIPELELSAAARDFMAETEHLKRADEAGGGELERAATDQPPPATDQPPQA